MKLALISVFDKTGIVEFAKALEKLNYGIISTGGSFKVLKEAGLDVKMVEDITNFPEILDGRVKTLNPRIHGGILYRRDEENHRQVIEHMDIPSIDLVVNNLYPFEETIKKPGVSQREIIENIDIGGPSMIRAAAKNYEFVTALVDPADYGRVIEELEVSGETSLETRLDLARKVFNYTSYYDTLISNYFNQITDEDFPDYLTLAFKDRTQLRYGENPHQEAAFYKEVLDREGTIADYRQLHGKELSFNNINDSNGALEALKLFDQPTAVAVKHANPCGIASGETILQAYEKAYACDPMSIFGGIVALNRPVDLGLANKLAEIFLEVIMAPAFTDEALEILSKKKNIRLLEIKNIDRSSYRESDMKKVLGGFLVQARDEKLFDQEVEIITEKAPSNQAMKDLEFAWKVAKTIKSNGVVLVKDQATIGIGMGEVNRVWAVENAIERSGEKVKGAVLASDGFFPFKDSIEVLAQAGVGAIIQPGGSVRDQEVIEEANASGIAMVFTGIRHFKH